MNESSVFSGVINFNCCFHGFGDKSSQKKSSTKLSTSLTQNFKMRMLVKSSSEKSNSVKETQKNRSFREYKSANFPLEINTKMAKTLL